MYFKNTKKKDNNNKYFINLKFDQVIIDSGTSAILFTNKEGNQIQKII